MNAEEHPVTAAPPGQAPSQQPLSDYLRERGRPWAADMVERAEAAIAAQDARPAPGLAKLDALMGEDPDDRAIREAHGFTYEDDWQDRSLLCRNGCGLSYPDISSGKIRECRAADNPADGQDCQATHADLYDEPPIACLSFIDVLGAQFDCGGTPGHAGKHTFSANGRGILPKMHIEWSDEEAERRTEPQPAPELADAVAELADEMRARADAPIRPGAVDVADRIVRAQVLHEYAARIRQLLGGAS